MRSLSLFRVPALFCAVYTSWVRIFFDLFLYFSRLRRATIFFPIRGEEQRMPRRRKRAAPVEICGSAADPLWHRSTLREVTLRRRPEDQAVEMNAVFCGGCAVM
jgi:hypothetical protein